MLESALIYMDKKLNTLVNLSFSAFSVGEGRYVHILLKYLMEVIWVAEAYNIRDISHRHLRRCQELH